MAEFRLALRNDPARVEAVETARHVLAMAESRGDGALVAEVREWLELYHARKPFRDSSLVHSAPTAP